MNASDVTATLEDALVASSCERVAVVHRPRLLGDNGCGCISGELADWLAEEGMDHVRGDPQTTKGDQSHRDAPLAASTDRGINSNLNEPGPPFPIRPWCPKSSDDGH